MASSKNVSANDLLAQVLKQEREASAAVGRNYAQKVTTYKSSLSLKADSYGVRRRSPSRDRDRERDRDRDRDYLDRDRQRKRSRTPSPPSHSSSTHVNTSKSKSDDQLRSLRERYGDASSRNNKD